MKKINDSKKTIVLVIIIVIIAFIFFNSLKTAEQSIRDSNRIVSLFIKVADVIYNGDTPERMDWFLKNRLGDFLRDFAHFFEFFILAVFTMLYSLRFRISIFGKLLAAIAFCIFISILDEAIQVFSYGRAFELYDLALDTAGAIVGTLIVYLFYRAIKKNF